jgi:hypothetical protein
VKPIPRLRRSPDSVDSPIAVTRKAFVSAFTRKLATEPAAIHESLQPICITNQVFGNRMRQEGPQSVKRSLDRIREWISRAPFVACHLTTLHRAQVLRSC